MLRPGTQDSYISRKVNMPTDLGHGALVSQVPANIKAQAFFSARVAEARILERLRSVSDQYSRGEIGLGEARNALKDFLKAEGYNPHKAGLKNLASTTRLNLILKQNAAMAHAAGEWKRMHDPDAMKVFPYVRYHSRGDSRSRFSHSQLDGKIFHKDDPFLKTHTPPWEFNCRCWLEEITAKEAGRHEEDIQERTPPDQVKVESQSGFSFDPEHVFEEFDLSSIKDAGLREKGHEKILSFCKRENMQMSLKAEGTPYKQSENIYREPENINEIKALFAKLGKRNETAVPPVHISVGKLLKEHIQRLGLKDFYDDIIFNHPGSNKEGTLHWQKHHNDTLNESVISIFRKTLWNPNASVREDINGSARRICIYVKDGTRGELTNIWVVKDPSGKLHLSLIDSWESPIQYIESLEKKKDK